MEACAFGHGISKMQGTLGIVQETCYGALSFASVNNLNTHEQIEASVLASDTLEHIHTQTESVFLMCFFCRPS